MTKFTIYVQKLIDKIFGPLICIFLRIIDPIFRTVFRKNKIENILIVRLWAVGETILTLPMIKALRENFPDAKISVLTQDRVKGVFESVDFIDEIIILGWKNTKLFKRFDIVFDTEPYLKVSAIMSWFVGKERIGFSHGIRSLLYTIKIKYNDTQHVVQTYFDMIRGIGIKADSEKLIPLNVGENDKKIIEEYLNKKNPDGKKLIGLCATSAESAAKCRRWPKEKFAGLADRLINKYNAKVIFVGTKDDIIYNESIIKRMSQSTHAINSAGETSLKQAVYLISKCDLFISNDTGPMHISATMGTKTIGLFGPNLSTRFGPYGPGNKSVYMKHSCSPCINVHKGEIPDCDNPICMEAISVEHVFNVAVRSINDTKESDMKNNSKEHEEEEK